MAKLEPLESVYGHGRVFATFDSEIEAESPSSTLPAEKIMLQLALTRNQIVLRFLLERAGLRSRNIGFCPDIHDLI